MCLRNNSDTKNLQENANNAILRLTAKVRWAVLATKTEKEEEETEEEEEEDEEEEDEEEEQQQQDKIRYRSSEGQF